MKDYQQKTKFNWKSLLVLSLFFISFNMRSQTNSAKEMNLNSTTVFLKLVGYNVDMDNRLQKKINQQKEFSTSYVCIPAGLLVIESKTTFDSTKIEKLKSILNSVDDLSIYRVLEGYTIDLAQNECSNVRNSK
jgi:hypothetical protein